MAQTMSSLYRMAIFNWCTGGENGGLIEVSGKYFGLYQLKGYLTYLFLGIFGNKLHRRAT